MSLAKVFPPKSEILSEQYQKLYRQSIENPKEFWGNAAKEHVDWFRPFDKVLDGGFEHGDVRWFEGGKLNISYNALDRHDPNALALIWEGDEPADIRKLTYGEVLRKVCKIGEYFYNSINYSDETFFSFHLSFFLYILNTHSFLLVLTSSSSSSSSFYYCTEINQ
jgi:hypothetical protein